MIHAVRTAHHHLFRNDRPLAMDPKRLFCRKVPQTAETFIAVTATKFPERGKPGGAVAFTYAWTGGDHPSLHHLLHKAVLDEAFPMNTAQFVGPKHTSPTFLKHFKYIKGLS